jgi:hypothetical protein
MRKFALLAGILISIVSIGRGTTFEHKQVPKPWHDETSFAGWKSYNLDNPPQIRVIKRSGLQLSLPHVKYGWPYAYQWSGVKKTFLYNVGQLPLLSLKVGTLQPGSYAHFEVHVLDSKGTDVKGLRSTTLTNVGVATLDLSKSLDPASYTLEVVLIVGGDNAGCSATYEWMRGSGLPQ